MPYKDSIRATWTCVDCGVQIHTSTAKRCRSCAGRQRERRRPALSDEAFFARRVIRFWDRVDRTGSCWLWRGYKPSDGYGRVSWGPRRGSAWLTHRVAWELTNGPIPHGLAVLHNCPSGDNPACVNPAHLWLGTQAENLIDMRKKGRAPKRRSSTEYGSKLVAEDVRLIRRLAQERRQSFSSLALRFGVHPFTIANVVHRRTWRHIA